MQTLATPGHRWVAYFRAHQSYQLEGLDQTWSLFAKKVMINYQLLQQTVNLNRLSSEEFIPIALFSSMNTSGGIEYWGRTSQLLPQSSLVLLGPEGILGRAEHQSEHFYRIYPMNQKDIQIPVMIEPKSKLIMIRGNGSLLVGFDPSSTIRLGSVLITTGSDIHYPAFYPVAKVTAVYAQSGGIAFEATPIQEVHELNYAILYQTIHKK